VSFIAQPAPDLFGLGGLLAGPGAGQALKVVPCAVVEEPADEAKDRPLEHQRRGELAVVNLAMLGAGRLLVVD